MPACPAPVADPAGTVPPDSREPSDPPPPPDSGGPTTGGPDAGGPTTGGGDGGGPTTGGGTAGGPATGGGDGGPSTGGDPTRGRRAQTRTDRGHWSYWWTLNRALVVDLASRVKTAAGTTPGRDDAREPWRADVRSALIEALGDSDVRVQEQAAWSLGKTGESDDVDVLSRILVDDHRAQAVREAAATAIGRLPVADGPAGDATRRMLQGVAGDAKTAPRIRAMCVYALGMRRDAASVPFLVDLARAGAPTWDVPAAALTALGMTGCPAVREELEHYLLPQKSTRSSSDLRRVYAAHGLALLHDAASLPALRTAALDENDDVRRAAILALGAVAPAGDAETVRALSSAFAKDHDRVCRGMAALSLGRLGGDAAKDVLRRAHAAGDVSVVRPYVALGLGLLARGAGDESIARALAHDLETNSGDDMAGPLSIAVGLARRAEAAPTLRSIAADSRDPLVRGHAAVALGLVGDTTSGPAVLRALLDVQIPTLQGEAAIGLGLLGDAPSIAALDDRLEHGASANARGAAAIAIGRIGGPDAARLLTKTMKDVSASSITRVSATVGLGLLLDRTGCRATGRLTGDLDWCATTGAVADLLGEM